MKKQLNTEGYALLKGQDIPDFSHLEAEIEKVKWIDDISGTTSQIPDFLKGIWEFETQNYRWLEQERIGLNEGLMQFYFPQPIIQGCENIWKYIFPNLKFTSAAILLWNGVHNVTQSWHWDGYDRSTYGDYFLMCYFNNYSYDSSYGGELEIAYTKDHIKQYDVEYEKEIKLETVRKIPPKHGNIIIIKTEFPFLVHRARAVTERNFNRYTLLNGIIIQ